jgi:hypothetical protein
MSLRRGLLALTGVVAVAGTVMAQQPGKPLVEGREPDPVVLQFYSTEPPTFGYGTGSVAPAPRAANYFAMPWLGAELFSDLLLNEFTMPLGTVPMWD